MKTYKTTTSDEGVFHVFMEMNDDAAKDTAERYCKADGVALWNLDEVDEEYNEIRNLF